MSRHDQCGCGRTKDRRSVRCSACAGSSLPVGSPGKLLETDLRSRVEKVTTIQELADHYGVKRDTVVRALRKYGIEITHFTRTVEGLKSRPERYLTTGAAVRYTVVKKLVLRDGLVEEICQECGLESTWNGKPIVLELDHRDGNPTNNSLDNLRFLCPNCHSQTPTFRGRKRK